VQVAAIVHSLPAVVWEADAATRRFEFVSRGAEVVLGYPVERWLHEPGFWASIIHPDDLGWASACWRAAAERGQSDTFEFRVRAVHGRWLWMRNSLFVAVDEQGRPRRLRGLMVDITEQRLGERRQQAQHEVTRMLAEASTLG
jgi:PAS domain S-box-containing protein